MAIKKIGLLMCANFVTSILSLIVNMISSDPHNQSMRKRIFFTLLMNKMAFELHKIMRKMLWV